MVHGSFMKWIEQKFSSDFSYQTANNYMKVYRYFSVRPDIIQMLPLTTLLALTKGSDEIKEEIIQGIDDAMNKGGVEEAKRVAQGQKEPKDPLLNLMKKYEHQEHVKYFGWLLHSAYECSKYSKSMSLRASLFTKYLEGLHKSPYIDSKVLDVLKTIKDEGFLDRIGNDIKILSHALMTFENVFQHFERQLAVQSGEQDFKIPIIGNLDHATAGAAVDHRNVIGKVQVGDPIQMRNFYAQFADGCFSSLDVMNFILHNKAVRMMKKDARILDVCCGQGLILPLIRYYARNIKEYVGVDVSQSNLDEQKIRSGIKNIEGRFPKYYPFKVTHKVTSVENMDQHLEPQSFDFVVYISSIGNMEKEAGYKSLENCYALMKPGAKLFLSCPNTMDNDSLKDIGFEIRDKFGIAAKKDDFDTFMETISDQAEKEMYSRFAQYLPTPWLMAFAPILYPEAASEVCIIASRPT